MRSAIAAAARTPAASVEGISGASRVSAWPAPPTIPPRPSNPGTRAIRAIAIGKLTCPRPSGMRPGSRFIARM